MDKKLLKIRTKLGFYYEKLWRITNNFYNIWYMPVDLIFIQDRRSGDFRERVYRFLP